MLLKTQPCAKHTSRAHTGQYFTIGTEYNRMNEAGQSGSRGQNG